MWAGGGKEIRDAGVSPKANLARYPEDWMRWPRHPLGVKPEQLERPGRQTREALQH